MLSRAKDWLDKQSAKEAFSYVFLAGLVLIGCCCGSCATSLFTWLWS